MSKTEFVIEPGRQDVVMIREFDAPRDLVFRACTEGGVYARWAGGPYDAIIDAWEPRHGGRYRWHSVGEDGAEYAFRGIFHQVEPEQTIFTFEWEGLPGHVCLSTVTLEELPDGRTRYTGLDVYQSVEDRDGMVANGMEEGAASGLDKLAEVLKTL